MRLLNSENTNFFPINSFYKPILPSVTPHPGGSQERGEGGYILMKIKNLPILETVLVHELQRQVWPKEFFQTNIFASIFLVLPVANLLSVYESCLPQMRRIKQQLSVQK